MYSFSSNVIVVAVVMGLSSYLMASSKMKPMLNSEGVMVLKMSKLFGIVGFMAVALAAVIAILAYFGSVTQENLWGVTILFTLPFGIGVLFILVSKNMRVEVDDEKITYYGITNKTKVILWEDITQVKFSKRMAELSLITSHEKIKIYMQFIGFYSFVELIKKRLDSSLYKEACAVMERDN